MVGRLVQQQDIGRGRQHPRQRRAAGFAARDMRRVFVAVQPELLQQVARLIMVVARAEAGLDIGQRRLVRRRNPAPAADSGWWRPAARSGCRCRARRGRRRSSSSVDLPEPLRPIRQTRSARRHRQFDARQQRRAAEGQRDVFQLDQRRRHRFIFNSGSAQAGPPAGAGCGGWSGRARTGTSSGRAAQTILARRSLRRTSANRSSDCAPPASCRSIVR